MTHVFVIHTHRDSNQIRRLVSALKSQLPNSIVLVSHDVAGEAIDQESITACGATVLRGRGGRGDFTILDGYRDAIRWLQASGIAYDWISNLSGQDFPARPLAEFERRLRDASADGFLTYFDALKQEPPTARSMGWSPETGYERYYFQYRKIKSTLSFAERVPLRYIRKTVAVLTTSIRINPSYGLMVGRKAARTPFHPSFTCYAGSYWGTIRRECADYLLKFCDDNQEVVAYYRRVLVPDESFIQTVLVNNKSFRIENDNFRYIDFSGSHHGRPKTLALSDAEAIRASGAHFCRKLESGPSDSLYALLEREIARL